MSLISVDEVRNRSGAPTSLVSDAQITTFISQVEEEMARWINTSFTPKQVIEVRDGNGSSHMFSRKNPLLSIREITVNKTTSVTPSSVNWNVSSGKIMLTATSEGGNFTTGQQNTFVKYIYGFLEESSTSTSSTAAVIVGSDVSISVSSITGFSDEDWVEIYGMDGYREVAQINATPALGVIQVDQLVKTHSSGSTVVLLQVPVFIKTYMMIEAAICVAINAIGATYVFNASYSLGDLQVTKGVPYTHWQSSVEKLYKERAMRKSRIKPRPSIMVD